MNIHELIESVRHLSACDPKHKKALRHAHHAFHNAYLWWYVVEWHVPVSLIVLPLAVLATASWVLPHLELE